MARVALTDDNGALYGAPAEWLNGAFERTLGPSNGSDDTNWVNDALAGGGYVRGVTGETYHVTEPLVLHSNTLLDMRGCRVVQTAGSPRHMVVNNAVNASRTLSDIATTSGSATVTANAGTFNASDVGKPFHLYCGDRKTPVYLDGTIVSVQSESSATLSAPAPMTHTHGGISIGPRDRNIEIVGGEWVRAATQNETESLRSLNMIFRRLDGLKVRDVSTNFTGAGGKYQFHTADVSDFEFSRIRFLNAPSDGIHIGGLCFGGIVNDVRGHVGDDLTAITAADYTMFNDVYGDVSDIVFDTCVIDGVTNDVNNPRAVLVGNNASPGPTTTTVRRISVRRAENQKLSYPIAVFVAGGCNDTLIEDSSGIVSCGSGSAALGATGTIHIRRHTAPATGSAVAVMVNNNGHVRKLVVEDSELTNESKNLTGVYFGTNAKLDELLVDNVKLVSNSTASVLVALSSSGNQLGRADLIRSGVVSTGASARLVSVGDSNSVIGEIRDTDCYLTGADYVYSVRQSMKIRSRGGKYAVALHNLRMVGAATVELDADGRWWISKEGTGGVLHSPHAALQVRVDRLNLRAGDMAFNYEASLSCGVGPVYCDGTKWINTVTGATYTPA